MTLAQLIETLPVLKLEALLEHRYFDATWLKKQEDDVKKYIHMNNALGAGSQFEDYESEE